MNQFEDQLRQTLSRKQPPAGFTEKVMLHTTPRNRFWRWQALRSGMSVYMRDARYWRLTCRARGTQRLNSAEP